MEMETRSIWRRIFHSGCDYDQFPIYNGRRHCDIFMMAVDQGNRTPGIPTLEGNLHMDGYPIWVYISGELDQLRHRSESGKATWKKETTEASSELPSVRRRRDLKMRTPQKDLFSFFMQ